MTAVAAPLAGRVIPLEEVDDEVFAERVMGDGVALQPSDGRVIAPVAGRVEKLFAGGHGVVLETPDGVQVLVHIGLDTVELKGDGFTVLANEGDDVAVGDLLITADLDHLRALGKDPTSPVVIISGHAVEVLAGLDVAAGAPLLEVTET